MCGSRFGLYAVRAKHSNANRTTSLLVFMPWPARTAPIFSSNDSGKSNVRGAAACALMVADLSVEIPFQADPRQLLSAPPPPLSRLPVSPPPPRPPPFQPAPQQSPRHTHQPFLH